MPYSSTSGKSLVDRAIIRMRKRYPEFFTHHRVIDIGAGSGTYSSRYANTWLPRSEFTWIGVEIWEPYVEKFKLNDKYDEIVVVDALEYLTSAPAADICFLGDVIEHMTREHAAAVINTALTTCRVVIVSLPIGHYPQDEYEGNPHERHVTDNWTMKDAFDFLPSVKFYAQDSEIGVFVLSNDRKIFPLLTAKIGVYGICKNEGDNVDKFMRSIKDADHVVICDTGSTDGTFERFQTYQATYPLTLTKIHVSPWRFDDARNCALLLLPEDLDICVSLDLDEQLDQGWYERLADQVTADIQSRGATFDRYNHRFRSIWNWNRPDETPNVSEHWHERIHSRKGFMWKLPVHEVLTKADGSAETSTWIGDVWMTQRPDLSKPRSSYLGMLEISVKEDPMRWKSWSFLASEYVGAGRYDDAITAINTAMAISDSDKAHLSLQASNIYRFTGRHDKAIWELMNAIQLAPHVREYHVYLSDLYSSLGRHREAVTQLELGLLIVTPTNGYSYNPSCWGESFDKLLASRKELL